ncbi:FHA domain protein [Aspergillus lucknowensis]|uniref:FHA domain-containing protein n=1 Tax=Aspergillus lucknowensis TaxID=176173 RepID=A0ABR4LUF5_9EURO
MPETRAVVLLHTLGLADTLPCRSLTFKSESDRIEIGRASKRENKNLVPAHHNALFDSRVMSRTHAIIRVSPGRKLVYIRDPGSMHGTWLNREKIPVDKDVTVTNGDVLTFGVEVVRGSDTFPPLAVRCECQWLETPDLDTHKQPQTSNTFCVPDDDYDDEGDCEVTSHNPVALDLTADQSAGSDASSEDSDLEDIRSVVEVPSPNTSPLKNDLKDTHPTEVPVDTAARPTQNPTEPSSEQPEDSEGPLATPIMTPPSVNYDSEDRSAENQYYDEYFAHNSDDDSNVDPEDWELDEEEENVDDDAFEHDAQVPKEPLDCISDSARLVHGAINSETDDGLKEVAPIDNKDQLPPAQQLPNDILGMWRMPPILSDNRLPEIKYSNTETQQREQPSSTVPPKLPPVYGTFDRMGSDAEPPLQDGGKLSDHIPAFFPSSTYIPLPVEAARSTPGYSLDSMPAQSSHNSTSHYKEGPFASAKPIAGTGAAGVATTEGSSKTELLPFMDPLAPMIPRMSSDAFVKPNARKSSACWPTLNTGPEIVSPKKRKATEMESEHIQGPHTVAPPKDALDVDETMESTSGEDKLPDVQQQNIVATVGLSDTQLTALSIPKSSDEADRPSKRVKTSGRASLRSHAATAILGAVVGAVGTIAALASLPPDYFA